MTANVPPNGSSSSTEATHGGSPAMATFLNNIIINNNNQIPRNPGAFGANPPQPKGHQHNNPNNVASGSNGYTSNSSYYTNVTNLNFTTTNKAAHRRFSNNGTYFPPQTALQHTTAYADQIMMEEEAFQTSPANPVAPNDPAVTFRPRYMGQVSTETNTSSNEDTIDTEEQSENFQRWPDEHSSLECIGLGIPCYCTHTKHGHWDQEEDEDDQYIHGSSSQMDGPAT